MIPIDTSNLLGLGDLLKGSNSKSEELSVDISFEELLGDADNKQQEDHQLPDKTTGNVANATPVMTNQVMLEHEYNFKLLNKLNDDITKAAVEHKTTPIQSYTDDLITEELVVQFLGRPTGLMAYQSNAQLKVDLPSTFNKSVSGIGTVNTNSVASSQAQNTTVTFSKSTQLSKGDSLNSSAQTKLQTSSKVDSSKSINRHYGYEFNQTNYQPFLFTLAASDKGLNIYYRNYFTKDNELKKYMSHLEQSGFKINRMVVNGSLIKGNDYGN